VIFQLAEVAVPRELFRQILAAIAALEAGAPIALSSDAHVPQDVGYAYDQALELLAGLGVSELAVFERRQRRLEPLGP